MSAHTPLPWSLAGSADYDTIDIEGPKPHYRTVAKLGVETKTRRADGELIVRAVNTHDDLLAACEALLDEADDCRESDAARLCRAAIAKAKGGAR